MHGYLKKFFGGQQGGFFEKQTTEVVPEQLYIAAEKKAEIILSDGRFVTIFKVKAGHIALSQDVNKMFECFKVMTYTVKVDDKPISMAEVFNLDVEDFNKICKHLFG